MNVDLEKEDKRNNFELSIGLDHLYPIQSNPIQWNKSEDELLYKVIESGEQNWKKIAGNFHGKFTEYDCYFRWNKELQPLLVAKANEKRA